MICIIRKAVRTAKIQNTDNIKCWWRCGVTGTLGPCKASSPKTYYRTWQLSSSSVLEMVRHWNTDGSPPTGQPIRSSLDLQMTSSNGKDEKCVAGRSACVLLGIQRKGRSECLVPRMLEGAGSHGYGPSLALCWLGCTSGTGVPCRPASPLKF